MNMTKTMNKQMLKNSQANKVKSPRRCVGCRLMFEKHSLIRVAKNKDGVFYIDKTSKPVGRGAYVCLNAKCVAKAAKSAGVERSFGQKEKVSVDNIYEHLAMEIEEFER